METVCIGIHVGLRIYTLGQFFFHFRTKDLPTIGDGISVVAEWSVEKWRSWENHDGVYSAIKYTRWMPGHYRDRYEHVTRCEKKTAGAVSA